MKESDFKELWKDNKTYEYVPLPKSVLKILKRQHNGYVLHAFIYHDTRKWSDGKDHKSMILGFDKIISANYVVRGPGVSCGMDHCVHDWDDLARKICRYMGYGYPIGNIGRLQKAVRVWEKAQKRFKHYKRAVVMSKRKPKCR